MNNSIRTVILGCMLLLAAGCASGPQVVYVHDAQEVTVKALEPVSIDGIALKQDVKKFADKLGADSADNLLRMISEQIARTKRFSVVQESISVGKNYILEPRIEDVQPPSVIKIPTDPTRKKMLFRARVRIDVTSIDEQGNRKKHKSFSDRRENEIKLAASDNLDPTRKQEMFYETVEVGFKAASNLLGAAFNPSYVFGTVTKINGRTAHVKIDTTKLAKMPKMKRQLYVVDSNDRNKTLAIIDGLSVDDGTASGTVYSKSGESFSEGAIVRAQVNDLEQ